MSDYLLQEDGSSKFLLEDSSGDLILEGVGTVALAGTSSLTAGLHARRAITPTLHGSGSLTARVSNPRLRPTFRGVSTLSVRLSPHLRPTLRGTSSLVAPISHVSVHVSQVSVDVLATNTAVPANVTQVCVEVLHPRVRGLFQAAAV